MHFARFFKLAWAVQLLVGVALFGVSFYIENEILQAFFAAPVVALVLALSLETGKAASIVWHRYLAQGASEDYPPITRLVSAGFRGGLVMLSLLCSLLYLGVQLDRPNLDAVRDAELAAIDTELAQALARLDAERETRLERDQRLVVELGIVLAFDTVTLSMRPALAAQHREEVMTEAMMAELNGTAEREGLRHRDAMDRVRKGGERIGERARAAANKHRDDQREAA